MKNIFITLAVVIVILTVFTLAIDDEKMQKAWCEEQQEQENELNIFELGEKSLKDCEAVGIFISKNNNYE